MGLTEITVYWYLFVKKAIRRTFIFIYNKGMFHARMGTIKDRNSKDLIETEEIKKKWQEYTE